MPRLSRHLPRLINRSELRAPEASLLHEHVLCDVCPDQRGGAAAGIPWLDASAVSFYDVMPTADHGHNLALIALNVYSQK